MSTCHLATGRAQPLDHFVWNDPVVFYSTAEHFTKRDIKQGWALLFLPLQLQFTIYVRRKKWKEPCQWDPLKQEWGFKTSHAMVCKWSPHFGHYFVPIMFKLHYTYFLCRDRHTVLCALLSCGQDYQARRGSEGMPPGGVCIAQLHLLRNTWYALHCFVTCSLCCKFAFVLTAWFNISHFSFRRRTFDMLHLQSAIERRDARWHWIQHRPGFSKGPADLFSYTECLMLHGTKSWRKSCSQRRKGMKMPWRWKLAMHWLKWHRNI